MQGGKAHRLGRRTALLAAMLVTSSLAQGQQSAPHPSIVSANLCADQLVLALADRQQIVSLSPFARDANISFLAHEAAGVPRNTGAAEELIRLSADLIVLGRYDNRLTRDFLTTKERPFAMVDSWVSLDETRQEIAGLAARFGHAERGAALIATIDASTGALEALASKVPQRSFLILHRRGYVLHAGLAGDLAVKAGLRNAAGDVGLRANGFVDLERVVAARPDYLMVAESADRPEDQGEALLEHPALRRLYPPARRLVVPDLLTICPGPAIPALAARLAQEITAKVR